MDRLSEKASAAGAKFPFARGRRATMMIVMNWVCRAFWAALLGLVLAANTSAWAQDFGSGLSAYNRGDYQIAMGIWRPLADRGDARSQAGLGFLFLRGLGTKIDASTAKSWYEKAAIQGQAEAQLMLGIMHYFGQGVPKSYVWAYAWCELANINGNPDAFECRDAAIESMTDSSQLSESYRLAQQLLKQQKAASP